MPDSSNETLLECVAIPTKYRAATIRTLYKTHDAANSAPPFNKSWREPSSSGVGPRGLQAKPERHACGNSK